MKQEEWKGTSFLFKSHTTLPVIYHSQCKARGHTWLRGTLGRVVFILAVTHAAEKYRHF